MVIKCLFKVISRSNHTKIYKMAHIFYSLCHYTEELNVGHLYALFHFNTRPMHVRVDFCHIGSTGGGGDLICGVGK